MADLDIIVGDTHVTLTITLKDENDDVIDLTSATTVHCISRHVATGIDTKAMTIADAVNGVCTVQVDDSLIHAGKNSLRAKITWNTGAINYSTSTYTIEGLRV